MSQNENDELPQVLTSLKQAIWTRRPILGVIMAKHGGKTLYDYSRDFMDVNKSPLLDARKPELMAVVKELLTQRLGSEIAEKVVAQLKALPLVSTTDHHGPIQHPFFLNANIISALPYVNYANPAVQYLVVFSFASVSVNNASGFARGIIFHGGMNGSGNFIRLPVLPDKLKMGVVYGTRSFTREDLTKAENELSKKEHEGELAPGRGDKIRNLLESSMAHDHVMRAPDLSSQITEINFHMWPKFFRAGGARIPDLIYLEIETIVKKLLFKRHLDDPASLIHRLLFNPEFTKLALKHFNNHPGAFSLEGGWGTYMFWGMDEKNHRIRLGADAMRLSSVKNKFSYEMTPAGIRKALEEKKIFPSMLLCYLMISLHYGMKCLGGFCQVHDLTMIKEAWRKLLMEIGENDEAEALKPVQTKELGGDGIVLAYLKTPHGDFVPATGIDMALETEPKPYEYYRELSKKVTLSEMMQPMLPEMYTVLYTSHRRDQNLLKFSPEEILKGTGLLEKLN